MSKVGRKVFLYSFTSDFMLFRLIPDHGFNDRFCRGFYNFITDSTLKVQKPEPYVVLYHQKVHEKSCKSNQFATF